MQAFILAAGLGTRLRPLTNDRPKALVTVEGRTLLEININNLIRQGASRIVVNVHHFADMIISFVQQKSWDAEVLISDEREMLLDTGGALKHAVPLFDSNEPVLVHNVDILSDIDFGDMLAHHRESRATATLAVSERETSRLLIFNDNQLVGWTNRTTDEYRWSKEDRRDANADKYLAYSGIGIIEPAFIAALPEADHPYPVVPEFLKAAAQHTVAPYLHDAARWLDVGKPETLTKAARYV
ncbi:MAG: nucleotidyltransferase family protein [Bacteroidales bacterium]|nr:nucleotidyltransferase family protein [Bacteroidales bacterium]